MLLIKLRTALSPLSLSLSSLSVCLMNRCHYLFHTHSFQFERGGNSDTQLIMDEEGDTLLKSCPHTLHF